VATGGSAARRYAEAVLEIALAEGGDEAVTRFRDSLDWIASALSEMALRLLRDPRVPLAQRVEAVRAAAEGQPNSVRSLLMVLVQSERIQLLPDIARAYAEIVERRAGIARARVTTATELDDDSRARVIEHLERATGKTIKATFAVDPGLLGGAKVQVGDRLIDASLRAQLGMLRAELAAGR
jgi:F-type H+-transporting ATPase subunit delta